jgi:hypothetical protein
MAEKTLQDLIAAGQPIPDEMLSDLYAAQRARDVGGLRAMGQGLTFNNADEIEAALRSMKGGGKNTPEQNRQNYYDTRNQIRKEYEQYSQEYPGESTMLELAGGALPMAFTGGAGAAPKAAGMLSKIAASPTARAMATGVATGALSGAGAAKELSDVPVEAANMAVMGAGLGSVLPSVGRGASGILSTIKDYISPNVQQKTAQFLSKAAKDAGMTPQQMMAKIVEDRQAGVASSNFASTSDELQALAERVAERSSDSAKAMRQDAANTLDYQPGRVMQRVKDDLRAGDYHADLDQTVRKLRADAPQWYEDAYSFGDVQHPDIAKILNHKDFADAFRTAKGIAETEALAAELRGEDPSKYKLKELYQTVTNDKGELTGFKLVDVPDVRTLDYLKRGIQANIDSAYKGQGMSTAKASALKEVLDPFLATVDRATIDPATGVSKYAQTRKMYGDEKEIINAFEAGRNEFGNMDHEDVSKWYDGLSDTAKQAARTGVARGIFNKMDKATQGGGSVAKVVGGSYNEDKLRPLFESDDKSDNKFDLFKAAMKREMELHDQAKDFLSASSRGVRAQSKENMESGAKAFGSAAFQAASGHPLGGARSLMNNVATAIANPGLNDEVAGELTKRLMSKDPKDVAAAVKLIEDYSASAEQAFKNKGRNELMAVSGITAAAPPPTEGGD